MAIKCQSGTVTTTTVSGNILTGSTPVYDTSGTYYSGTATHTFSENVTEVTMTTGAGSVYYRINGKTVTFSYSSSLSGARQPYAASVTYGVAPVTVKNVTSTSGKAIDYINTNKDATKYMWTRPVDFQLQLPWDYIESWTLSRAGWGTAATNSMCVDSTAGVIKSTDSSYTGTNTYTLSYDTYGIRYGDYLTLTLTPKVCATLSQTTFTCKVDKDHTSIKNTSIATGNDFDKIVDEQGIVTASISGGVWPTDDNYSDYADQSSNPYFNLNITKSSKIKDLAIEVGLYYSSTFTECWYTKNANLVVRKDDSCKLQYKGTDLSSSSSTYSVIATIPAGTLTDTFALNVWPDEDSSAANKAWPKSVVATLRYRIVGGTHCFSTTTATDAVSEGQWTTGGDAGSGGSSYGS